MKKSIRQLIQQEVKEGNIKIVQHIKAEESQLFDKDTDIYKAIKDKLNNLANKILREE